MCCHSVSSLFRGGGKTVISLGIQLYPRIGVKVTNLCGKIYVFGIITFVGITKQAESNSVQTPILLSTVLEQFCFDFKMSINLVFSETRDGTLKSFWRSS